MSEGVSDDVKDNELHQNYPKHRAKFHASGGPDLGVKNQNVVYVNQSKLLQRSNLPFCIG